MKIVRDYDTAESLASEIALKLGIEDKPLVLDSFTSPLKELEDDVIVYVTSMPAGLLKYHDDFFEYHKNKAGKWIVILVNDDKVTFNQLKIGFSSVGTSVDILLWSYVKDDKEIFNRIKSSMKINNQKVLIYSIRPCCGKKTLAQVLSSSLNEWEFQVAEENSTEDYISQTDARYIIIVGRTMEDFNVHIPEGRSPIYVFTMPDENIQAYLKKDELPQVLVKYVPEHLEWTPAQAQKYFFFISPLYELWRINNVDPTLDNNFVMWDEYGLPMMRSEYTCSNVRKFLGQFNQSELLLKTLKSN